MVVEPRLIAFEENLSKFAACHQILTSLGKVFRQGLRKKIQKFEAESDFVFSTPFLNHLVPRKKGKGFSIIFQNRNLPGRRDGE